MTIKVWVMTTGMMGNNVSILVDEDNAEAIIVDPSFEPEMVLDFIEEQQLKVSQILLTHGHFDHFAGVSFLLSKLAHTPRWGLHHDDLPLLLEGGGSRDLHFPVLPPGNPDFLLDHGQVLSFAGAEIQVRLAPGHTPGSVIFYIPQARTAICGDVILHHGVGRTDLPGGSQAALLSSIQNQVFTLPEDTRLIPGHGEETTVLEEKLNNPFLGHLF